MLDESASTSFDEALDREAQAQTVNIMGADVAEAFLAFVQKRDPAFTGACHRSSGNRQG